MQGMKRDDVAAVPLFDRLVDVERRVSREPRPLRTLGRSDLLESIEREVAILLNSRCNLTVDAVEAASPAERSVLDYGVPDLGWADPGDPDAGQRLTRVLAATIAAFEPRLQNVSVKLSAWAARGRELSVVVSAAVVMGRFTEAVSFPIVVATTGQPEGPDER